MNVIEFLKEIKTKQYYRGQLVHIERIPARRAKYGKLKEGLAEDLVEALKKNGTNRLFSHQITAIDAIRGGGARGGSYGNGQRKNIMLHYPGA